MKRPLKRNESDGWFCQYVSSERSRSGRRNSGRSSRGGAADDDVVAAAGAGVAAVEHEFLGAQAR